MDAEASLYSRANDCQREVAKEIYKEFSKVLRWREDGKEKILEIGCGPGDITMEFILPILPSRFDKYVGVDLSQDMVSYARSSCTCPRISFEQWDMAGDTKSLLSRHPGGFDHIFSHFTLHWHSNQRKILENIFELLNPNGECILVFVGEHDTFEAMNSVVNLPKWQALFAGITIPRLPFHFDDQRVEKYRNFLYLSGFRDYKVEERNFTYVYRNSADLKRNIAAVIRTIQNMKSDQQDELFRDFIKQLPDSEWVEWIDDGKDYRLNTKFKLMVIHARK